MLCVGKCGVEESGLERAMGFSCLMLERGRAFGHLGLRCVCCILRFSRRLAAVAASCLNVRKKLSYP
jgi:hypothetical protein